MINIISSSLFIISTIFWICCIAIAIIGGCSIETEYNSEEWNNKKCKKLYYRIFAPVAVFSLIGGIIFQFIDLIFNLL